MNDDTKEVLQKIETLRIDITQELNHIYSDLDLRLDNVEKVMIAQEINLKEHMRRTDALEDLVRTIQDKELKPLHRHVAMVDGGIKLIGIVSLVVGVILGFSKILSL